MTGNAAEVTIAGARSDAELINRLLRLAQRRELVSTGYSRIPAGGMTHGRHMV
jgi:hypothetical protein